ncbi:MULTISPECIES: RICIN domain-containing protein [unclassified Kitasatospora]|uniref:RICIN domain-containing protein n=1 Tax=unclassified Kitasatospora TaxID=2633591 RepID=UPI0036C69B8C
MTNPRRSTVLRALGATTLAALSALTLPAAPATAAPQGLASTEWHGYVCDDGYTRIRTPFNQLVERNQYSTWAQAVQNPDTGGYNQQWKLCHHRDDSQAFIFRNRQNENFCLGLWKENPADPTEGFVDGAVLSVFDCTGLIYSNQVFGLIHPTAGSQQVLIRISHSGSMLTIADPNGGAGSPVTQYGYRATAFTLEHLAG